MKSMETSMKKQAHIVLVHGACGGAWCWYKLKPLLETCGLRVTALDLAASGINSRSPHEVRSFEDYTQPLLELMQSLPKGEKVVLVGHSFGGMSIALAMDKFPERVSVGIFLAAFMPDLAHGRSHVVDEFMDQVPTEDWLDTAFSAFGTPEEPQTSILFGPRFFSSKICQLCSPEDIALAKMLARPCSLFKTDLSNKNPLSNEGFGSVKRCYIACIEDMCIPINFQRWMIETTGVDEAKEIETDHMVMFSKPHELSNCLVEIATKYN